MDSEHVKSLRKQENLTQQELAVCGDSLDVVPMLNNLSVLKAENVIEGNMLAGRRTELAFADTENLVALGQSEVQLVIYHYHVILSHPLESGAQPVNAIGNGRIVLDVAVAVDSSAAELGGWEDWGWVAFNEIHSSLYDMRLGMKDFAMYDLQTGKYYPEGKLNIAHEDWVFLRDLDGFIPMTYKISIEVEDGLYEVEAHTCNATTWGATHKVPDMPVATLTFDRVEGGFTQKDGKVRVLAGGRGTMSVRQWHAYPSILPRELYLDSAGEVSCDTKFDTL